MESLNPIISIVTVVYNGAEHLEPTILSVINQTYTNIQYIIIDGGSKDGTTALVKKYEAYLHHWRSEKDNGIYDAMNKGIDVATGDWIIFMNCGDRFASTEILDLLIKKFKSVDVIYGDALVEYPTFQKIFNKAPLEEMWKRMPFCHQATFVKTSLMKSLKFNTNHNLSSDYGFIYRVYLNGGSFLYIDEIVCLFDYKLGASIQNSLKSINERKNIVLELDPGLNKRLYYSFLIYSCQLKLHLKRILGYRLTQWITRYLNT